MKRILSLLAPLCLAASLNAMAGEAYVAADTSMLAGPDTQYPSIVELPAGVPVQVQGCIDGWTWCDVIAGGDRGWVPGNFLVEDFDNRRVIVTDYGPRIRIPIVIFSVDRYWGAHYRHRPWYAQRVSWHQRAIRPRLLQRPANININIRINTNWHGDRHRDDRNHHDGRDYNHHDRRHEDGNHNVRPIRAGHGQRVTNTKTATRVTTNRTHVAAKPAKALKPNVHNAKQHPDKLRQDKDHDKDKQRP